MKKTLFSILLLFMSICVVAQESRQEILKRLMDSKDSIASDRELQRLVNSDQEDQLSLAISFYRMKNAPAKVDSLQKLAGQKFPTGSIAYNNAIGVFSKKPNYSEKVVMAEEIKKHFQGNDFTYLDRLLAIEAAKNNDCKTLKNSYNAIKETTSGIPSIPKIVEGLLVNKTNLSDCMKEIYSELTIDYRNHLKSKLVNEEAPNFSLKDLSGKEVSLASLKGKTIILDFWATWCGPCVNSFPGMQKAVDKYKNDSSVAFLFINTSERGTEDPTEKLRKFIDDRNFTFDVLVDQKDKNTKKYAVSDAFQITGLPTKIIIDKNGQIRFKIIGSNDANDFIPIEITMMVDMIK
ncbi:MULTISPECIES: TlpA family protein disulfide reductase [Sphingobacterium]|uniref:TlpA family protein disulfide reductase n=1 Tax=Sphingobacterium TaxID=28453 RepID=UPI001049A2AD|nr:MULTISPECIES: TlpA disulfide reductase family protein [Sphingobacterium]MCW2263100.1 peroxiredoxin [Sphingobacterium kitahiroshimense]TCR11916.1 peroxiredoxin [Sphingobacterium sp. JUb78]